MRHILLTVFAVASILIGVVPAYSDTSQAAKDTEAKGEAALKSGDLDAAIAKFSEAIRLDPGYVAAYSNRGLAHKKNRDYDKAVADFNEAIRLDPELTAPYNGRADAYFCQLHVEKAIADYSEAIRLDPECRDAYIDRSNVYGFKGDCDNSMADAAEAVRLDKKCNMAINAKGVAFDLYARVILRSDEKAASLLFDRAAAYFEGPPEIDDAQKELPFDGSIEHFRAAATKLDRMRKAQLLFDYSAACFKSALAIRPDYDFGNNNLGVYYARPGGRHDVKQAEMYFRAAVKSSPYYADALNNLGIVLAEQGKIDDAIAAHKACLAVRGNRASDHINLCRVYLQKGDLDSALKENSVALKCDRKFLPAWGNRVEIYATQKNLDEAAKCIQVMIAFDAKASETIYAQYAFARKSVERKRVDGAISLLGQHINANPTIPEIYAYRGEAYFQKGDLVRAKQDFEQVLRLRPQFPGVQARIDAIQAKSDKPAEGAKPAKGGSND